MPVFQLVPLATVQNDIDIFWPAMTTVHNLGDGWDGNAGSRYTAQPIGGLFSAKIGVGVANLALNPQGAFVGQLTSIGGTAAFLLNGFNIRPPLAAGGAARFRWPSWVRIWRWQVVFMLQGPVIPTALLLNFIGFMGNAAGGPGAPGNGYAGLSLDVDGAWKWVSRVGLGGFGLDDGPIDLGLPGGAQPAMADFVFIAATDTAPAFFQLYLNGQYSAPAIQRAWGPGSVLPDYATAAAPTCMSFNPFIAAADVAVPTVQQYSFMRCSAGQFNPLGAEV